MKYIIIIKEQSNDDFYSSLEFTFNNLDDALNFIKTVFKTSNYIINLIQQEVK